MRMFLMGLAMCSAAAAQAEDTTMIVLDASGSMWGQIDGVNKIVIARDVVRESLGSAAMTQPMGLIAYGHNRKGDCSDIEVLVPPAQGTAGAVVDAVNAINPRGKTPLTEAVRQAATTMRHTENRATVVLVTDGLETCDADPCALARELEQSGVDFTAHVVGFGLSKADGAAVSCLAAETGGRYFEADNKGELAAALELTVTQDITPDTVIEEPPQVEPKHNLQINVQLSPDSPPVENGQIDKLSLDLIRQSDGKSSRVSYDPVVSLKVEEGDYVILAKYAGGEVELPVTVERFDVTHATLVLDAGVVDFRAVPLNPDALDPDLISWRVTNLDTGARQDRYEPDLRSVFAVGRYEVMAILGRKEATAPAPVAVNITAGDTSAGEIQLPHGTLRLMPVDEAGQPLPESFLRFALWTAKTDGSPDRMVVNQAGTRRALVALPGDYVLLVEDWGIAGGGKRKITSPYSVTPGSQAEMRVIMPADPARAMHEQLQ